MKKYMFIIMMLALTSAVFATPYASQIRVSSLQVYQGTNLTITYYINEAGGTASINIIKASDLSVVAAFTGTATKGKNTVVWNGTVDNASGAKVDVGNYKVKITVNASKTAGWTEIASNSSLGNYIGSYPTMLQTLWDGFSGMEMYIPSDPTKDSFGYILCSTSANSANPPSIHGHAVFNPDLSCANGGDGQTLWMKFPVTPPATYYTTCWGNCPDPDNADYMWVEGQNPTIRVVMYGKYNDATSVDVTGGVTGLNSSRDIAVDKESGVKYAYIAGYAASTIFKVTISGNALSGTATNILSMADTALSNKGVDFDSSGNLYYSVRSNEATTYTGGKVFRWSAAQVASAGAGSLNEANAQWNITFPTNAQNVEGVGISPAGDVYAAVAGIALDDGTIRGIYYIGNASTVTLTKTLDKTVDRIVPFQTYNASQVSGYALGVAADYAGNVLFVDRTHEQIREYGPGGTSSKAVVAPNSQTFEIVSLPLSAHNWAIYE